ncbi:uncharacterized protein J4E88_009082 [Alternaria novae-zelandiae]|uniref:uncharacterized protein n=1 Tax=Alternaria novae-zelandiae TaxID=430562 RepID=UPI0020C217DA|nr:uncharacterized protein J4E88_009082 [Alternaria novae-zelandiae]KAI4671417.1 hypothetical protein J4E88_009082 [Alternaria novae-zelandiae]
MAEVIGLAASIIQIAGAGAKLSVALYNFTNSAARADQDVKDIADDVELTSNALESVGRVFESEEAGSIVSKKAIQDANNIIKKCQSVFDEVSEIVEKRRKTAKDGKKSLSAMGKLAWPMKEQRVELNRRRLESLKNSLVLLLHVLQLAQGQARGRMEKGVLEEERDKIRELHQRQQDSLKSLQALENRFCHVALGDEETLRRSSIASRVPTLELMTSAPVMELPPLEKRSKPQKDTITIDLSTADDSDTSDSDATMSGDDNEEQISTEELAKAADHVKKLLKRITMLQKNFDVDKKKHRKRHVHKMYQRFCRKFESGIKLPSAADFGKVSPFIDFNMDDDGGQLESFDFDSFLHVQDKDTQFPLDDFYFSQEQRSVPQQTTNLDALSSTQSPQHPPLLSHESVETVPSFDAQTPHNPPVPSGSTASDFPLDLSGQQQRPSLGQGQSALAQQPPEALSQTWAQIQRQAQYMAQQQAQAQHQQAHWQHQQAHSQASMQPMSGMVQSLRSPAMLMLNRPMLPPVSTSNPSMPTYSRPVIPEISQSSQSGVESSLHNQSPTLTADSTLLPQPPSPTTALRDYQYQLMFLDCRKRKRKPLLEREQDGTSQSMTDNSMTENITSQPESSARQDAHASPRVSGWPSAGSGKVWEPYNLRLSSSSGYARLPARPDLSVLSNLSHQARTPSNASMIDPYPSRLPDDGTEQDDGQRSSRKRRRLVKDEDEPCTKDAADLVLKLEENEEMRETEPASSPVDRDIVDVLLDEWTVPVY